MDVAFVISVCSGLFLTVSETLPFISKIESNGILHLIANVLARKGSQTQTNNNELAEKLDILIKKVDQLRRNESN